MRCLSPRSSYGEFPHAAARHAVLLYDVLTSSRITRLHDREPRHGIVDPILEEFGRFSENSLFPLNRIGDAQGCRLMTVS